MLALKDIPEVVTVLGGTPISKSKIWSTPVDRISRHQLAAFRARMKMNGQLAQADAVIDYLQKQVAHHTTQGDLPLFDYVEPSDTVITTTQLVDGLAKLSLPARAAVLFGLETRMTADDVAVLTWDKAKEMARRGKLTAKAVDALNSQPVHIASRYVFWHQGTTKVLPVFGLEHDVFDAFNMAWGQLLMAYPKLVNTHY